MPIDVDAMRHRPAVADRRTSSTARRARARSSSGAASRGSQLACQIDGGGHENGLRSGTLNVPGIVGLGRAAEICRTEMAGESARLAALRDRLLAGLRAELDGVRVNGSLERRLPHNLHVSFDGVEGEALLMALGDLAVSTGSACSSGSQAPSHVLQAIGAVGDRAGASIRFGLGRTTTDADIDFAIERVTTVVKACAARGGELTAVSSSSGLNSQAERLSSCQPELTRALWTDATRQNHRRPQPRFRRRVHVLRPGERPRRYRRHRRRAGAGRHRDAESRGVRRQVRSHGRVVPRLRAPRRQVRAAAARRQHGRQLRPDRRRAAGRRTDGASRAAASRFRGR